MPNFDLNIFDTQLTSVAHNPLGYGVWVMAIILLYLKVEVFSRKVFFSENRMKNFSLWGPHSETVRFEKNHFCHYELPYQQFLMLEF